MAVNPTNRPKRKSRPRRKLNRLQRILELDPVKDHHEIYVLSRGYEFTVEFEIGGLMSFLHDFTIPSIAFLLFKTMEFNDHTLRRIDDTSIILLEIVKHGYDSKRGQKAIQRMNEIHQRFRIANNDFLYVLSSIVFEPIYWINRYGYRQLTYNEKQAAFYFWREVGVRMHLQNLPETYEAFEEFNRQFKQERVRSTRATRMVGNAVIDAFVKKFAYPLQPLMRQFVYFASDWAIHKSFGTQPPSPFVAAALHHTLRLRADIYRYFLNRRKAFFPIDHPMDTYQKGYKLSQVGADKR